MSKISPRVGFKIDANANPRGIMDNYYRPLVQANKPVGTFVLGGLHGGNTGPVMELLNLAKDTPGFDMSNLFIHYKITGVVDGRYVDVPDYNIDPLVAAKNDFDFHYWMWEGYFGVAFETVKRYVWFGINNEPDRTRTEWLAAYSREQLRLADRKGVRLAVMAWSTGTPDVDAWDGPEMVEMLNCIRQKPSRRALALHEYSLDPFSLDTHLVGRWGQNQKLWDVPIIFPEFGWVERWLEIDAEEAMAQLADMYRSRYAHPNILGLGLWTTGKEWGNLSNVMIDLMPLVADWVKRTEYEVEDLSKPDPEPEPDPEPPPSEPVYKLVSLNPVFNNDWTDMDGTRQVPMSYDLRWQEGYSEISNAPYNAPEVVHKARWGQPGGLPEDESEKYINPHSDYCLKVFDDNAFRARLVQVIPDAEPGEYLCLVEGYLDAYRMKDGKRDYAVDPQQAQMIVRWNRDRNTDSSFWPVNQSYILVDDVILPPSGPIKFVMEAHLPGWQGGDLQVAVHMSSEWPISNNWFLSKLAVYKVDKAPDVGPPEEPSMDVIDEEIIAFANSLAPINWDAAIQQEIAIDQMTPLGREKWFRQSNGLQVAVQPAMDEDGLRWAYYCIVPNWQSVFRLPMDNQPVYSGDAADYVMVDAEIISQRNAPDASAVLGFGPKLVRDWGCLARVYHGMLNQRYPTSFADFHERMKTARAFVGSNLVPSALELAYPNIVDSIGWYARGHAKFNEDVITQLGLGMPVGIRVDFKPLTPDEEQHWVMVVGYRMDSSGNIEDYVVLDPWDWNPEPKWLSEDYNVEGQDALEVLRYRWVQANQGIVVDIPSVIFGDGDDTPVMTFKHFGGPHDGVEEMIQMRPYLGLLIKNSNYEEIFETAGGVVRRVDTSPDETSFYYTTHQNGGDNVWLPRKMRVGETWVARERVVWSPKHEYNETQGYSSDTHLRLADYQPKYKLFDGSTVPAIIIEWLVNGQVDERYVYTPFGMVRWEKPGRNWYSEVVKIDWEHPDLPIPVPPPGVEQLYAQKGWDFPPA